MPRSRLGTIAPPLARGCQLALAVVLLYSASVHLSNPYAYILSMSRYGITYNEPFLSVLAYLFPVAHTALAVWLLAGFNPRCCLLLTSVLMAVYAGAQAFAVSGGNEIPCGCFSHTSTATVSWRTVATPAACEITALLGAALTRRGRS
ncbi:MAG TPA: MauE/DoxX family redox-associated membrane protein [Urbifossiella sp.]|nr:MauE/DoxX family redox-associated membrane protein [Urbifossiella sp.]